MEFAFRNISILAHLKPVAFQAVRHKGVKKYNRINWRPIPPKTRRDSFYKQHEPLDWKTTVLNYKKKLADQASEPLPPPSPMHVVSRCKSLKGQTKECKALCSHFGIGGKLHKQVVIPNSSSNNELLMQIKHLIRIKPLSLPQGLPETSSETWNSQLKTDGSLHIIKSLQPIEDAPKPTRLMCNQTLLDSNRRQMDNYGLLREYVKTKYVWRYNEDNREFSYRPKITD